MKNKLKCSECGSTIFTLVRGSEWWNHKVSYACSKCRHIVVVQENDPFEASFEVYLREGETVVEERG
jgi:DNA-directed RNA polymerase subunit RPC12/RpoP